MSCPYFYTAETTATDRKTAPSRRALALLLSILFAALPGMAQSSRPPRNSSASAPARKALPEDPRTARQAFERGQRAEEDGDWETAFREYSQAAEKSPADRAIRLRQELARFALVQDRTG